MIRKLKSGQYRLYSRKINPKTGKRSQPRYLPDEPGRGEARARGAIFQAPRTLRRRRAKAALRKVFGQA